MPARLARDPPAVYRRREPEKTVLHALVREHLATLIEALREPDDPGSGLPRFVEEDFRAYVRCGILACGLIRVHCECGVDAVVAYSCKGRGMCPSCGARRMFETAANLVDHVLPEAPLRQWVLSSPFELRGALAGDSDLLCAVNRIFVDEVERWMLRKAEKDGFAGGQIGAVTFVQRFGSALNLHPHLHTLAIDGLYRAKDDGVEFHAVAAPTADDERVVSLAVCRRVERLLVRRGLVGDDVNAADGEKTALMRWYARAMAERAKLSRIDERGRPWSPTIGMGRPLSTGDVLGFSVHARTWVAAHDRAGRERLCRYAGRPPLADAQLSKTTDGQIAFELSKPRWNGETHLVMDPLPFLRRIAWLVPPPRIHAIHYHGFLAPAAKLRSLVVPGRAVQLRVRGPLEAPACAAAPPTSPYYISRAKLLKRVYNIDLMCPRCGREMRPIAAIEDPNELRRILTHLGLPADEPKLSPPRWPP